MLLRVVLGGGPIARSILCDLDIEFGRRAGRAFTATDHVDDTDPAIVNQAFVDLFWPGENSLGKRFSHDRGATWTTIVGMMALGAHHSDVIRSVLGRGLIPVAIGTFAGVGLAAAGSRLLSGLLFEVDPLDLTTYLAVAALLLIVGIAATLIPARRAAAIDPMGAIRLE